MGRLSDGNTPDEKWNISDVKCIKFALHPASVGGLSFYDKNDVVPLGEKLTHRGIDNLCF